MDRFESLRTFVAVVEHEGFAAASRALDLAPAVVTRRVADLEQRLGVRLLNRTTRSVSLTSVGAVYHGRVRELPAALEAADLTLLLDDDEPLDGEFVARAIACTTPMLCAAPAYLQAHGPIDHPAQLEQHTVLLPTLAALGREVTFRHGRAPLESESSDAMLAAALAGYGVVGGLSFVTAALLASGRLVRVLPDWQVGGWRVYAAYQRQASLTPAARVLLDHLCARLGSGERDPWLDPAAPRRP